ncbi:MAG: flippase-like domain-containing protein [Gemmatimonadales bacterium]|nr:flippase-like domain-containing protein [Gemmatimonadales bacterium]
MAKLLTPKLLRRGLEFFVIGSVIGFAALLYYSGNFGAFMAAIPRIQWLWVLAGLGLASMDWLGGGLRLWVLAREIHPKPSFIGLILAGGMGAWAAYLTPLQSGNGPITVYTMRRYGIPVPSAITLVLMSFVSTVAFFGLAGPIAIAFGAGKSLGQHGVVLGISLYDLFLASLGIFVLLFGALIVIVIKPRALHWLLRKAIGFVGRRSSRVLGKLEMLEKGVDQAHDAMEKFNTPRGWLALFWATVISGPSHANKLLAGYVALRAIGIEAHFVDVLLLQTLIAFLLYFFAPTPGGTGIAEFLSAAVMSVYVPRPLTALYTLIWRLVISYFTIGFGSLVFMSWVRKGLKGVEQDTGTLAVEAPPAA